MQENCNKISKPTLLYYLSWKFSRGQFRYCPEGWASHIVSPCAHNGAWNTVYLESW